MSDLIELANVSKSYRRGSERIAAVRDLSLIVGEGEFIAVVGPSGSGKTTLLNLIGCVEKPDAGSLRLDGDRIEELDEGALTKIRSRKIGFVFQQFFLLPTLSAQENVQLPALFLHNGDKATRAAELLERVGLSGRGRHLPVQLSGGEMQRVAIARALINEPKILLADEPTGNLDSRNAQNVMEVFRELNVSGLTIMIVTHNVELANECDRIVRLKDGMIEST